MGAATALALRLLRAAGEPGHTSAGGLAAGLAFILRRRAGPGERLLLASAGLMALDQDARLELIQAAERDRQMFNRVAREHIRRNPLPPAPPGFDPFAESPRAKLVHAWSEASDSDRRDLVNRATGRVRA